jgi:hypothetical protein
MKELEMKVLAFASQITKLFLMKIVTFCRHVCKYCFSFCFSGNKFPIIIEKKKPEKAQVIKSVTE